jgi:EAL domain-containing protein (putative c-di-GMP-specific phosphodiesterase class I)
MVLFSSMPGALGGAHQETFIELLQTLLGSAMARLKNLGGDSQAISIPMRQHWAMLLRSDSLVMHYQPQFNLRTGRVSKVEALARLHDNGRAVRPNEFLPALTSDDLLELYARGLNHALADRQRWAEQGQDLGIAINMPPAALHDRRYFETTVTAMRAHACPVDRLTLEMLETEEVSSGVDVAGMLSRFKAWGVQRAEDDLGSGYSGLSRLRDMPFDVIKIDRSLATLTEGDPSIVLRFIYQLVRLGHTLGKQTIVEGVENVDLLEAITLLGADVVQGYVIAHPMPAEDLMLWLRSDADARLDLPDPRHPRSLLAKLARLLIWEERLHLLLHDKQEAPAFSPSLAKAIALESSLREPSIHQYLGLPFAGKLQPQPAAQAQETLFHAALEHGLTSADYRAAREELVSLLGST